MEGRSPVQILKRTYTGCVCLPVLGDFWKPVGALLLAQSSQLVLSWRKIFFKDPCQVGGLMAQRKFPRTDYTLKLSQQIASRLKGMNFVPD